MRIIGKFASFSFLNNEQTVISHDLSSITIDYNVLLVYLYFYIFTSLLQDKLFLHFTCFCVKRSFVCCFERGKNVVLPKICSASLFGFCVCGVFLFFFPLSLSLNAGGELYAFLSSFSSS